MKVTRLPDILITLIIGLLLLISSSPLFGEAGNTQEEYFEYFTDFENVLLIKPGLIKEIFYGIAELKGNPETARKILNKRLFACQTDGLQQGNCRLDQLKLAKREKKIPNSYTIPINFFEISITRYNKNQKLVTLQWKPVMFSPPTLSVSEFLSYIFASEDSKYYQVDPDLLSIQVTSHFEKQVQVRMDNRVARNLQNLYKNPPKDFRDSLTFFQSSSSMVKRAGIGTLNIFMKPKLVRINHLEFTVEQDQKLQ